MRPGLTFQVAPVELVQTLKRDAATLLGAEQRGDFLPRSALLPLFADEVHEWFQTAVKGASAAGALALYRLIVVDDFWIHQHRV
jgi:hypothetical protein